MADSLLLQVQLCRLLLPVLGCHGRVLFPPVDLLEQGASRRVPAFKALQLALLLLHQLLGQRVQPRSIDLLSQFFGRVDPGLEDRIVEGALGLITWLLVANLPVAQLLDQAFPVP